jgi:hypothetical protein
MLEIAWRWWTLLELLHLSDAKTGDNADLSALRFHHLF